MFDPVSTIKIIVFLIFFSLLFMLERRYAALTGHRPYKVARGIKRGAKRPLKNMGLWAINTLLSPLLIVPLTAWAASHALWRLDEDTALLLLPVHIIALDLWIYFWHRVNHEWRFLWRFHKVHHLDEALDTTTALRFHFGEVILSALVRAPVIILLAAPLSAVIIFETALLAATLFHHSNWRLWPRAENILSRIIITPGLHRIHHHNIQSDTDSNYGTIFSFWDRLFQTRRSYPVAADHAIGAEGEEDQSFMRLFFLPFYAIGVNKRGQ